jgi:hypothetical protein
MEEFGQVTLGQPVLLEESDDFYGKDPFFHEVLVNVYIPFLGSKTVIGQDQQPIVFGRFLHYLPYSIVDQAVNGGDGFPGRVFLRAFREEGAVEKAMADAIG